MRTQLEILKGKLRNEELPSDEVLNDLLESSKLIILNRRYPFHDFPIDEETEEYKLEKRYMDLQIRIAVELFAKEGAEGETNHTENGVSRNYASAGVSPALLDEIVPKGKVLVYEES
jgi:hypothetical protein